MKDHERTWTVDRTRDLIDGYLKRAKDGPGASKTSNILSKARNDKSVSLSHLTKEITCKHFF